MADKIITYNYALNNLNQFKKKDIPNNNICMTKSKVIEYLNIDTNLLSNYSNNRLVPISKVVGLIQNILRNNLVYQFTSNYYKIGGKNEYDFWVTNGDYDKMYFPVNMQTVYMMSSTLNQTWTPNGFSQFIEMIRNDLISQLKTSENRIIKFLDVKKKNIVVDIDGNVLFGYQTLSNSNAMDTPTFWKNVKTNNSLPIATFNNIGNAINISTGHRYNGLYVRNDIGDAFMQLDFLKRNSYVTNDVAYNCVDFTRTIKITDPPSNDINPGYANIIYEVNPYEYRFEVLDNTNKSYGTFKIIMFAQLS